tara:strand:+ start:2698 stop:3162 length:465 start_codon:yes stop_codon:yes gene_type:complete
MKHKHLTVEVTDFAHPHIEVIVAKAANMDLVVLYEDKGSWFPCAEANQPYLPDFNCMDDYFLCLPKHKDACLHWLNGGELMIDYGKGLGEGSYTLNVKRHNPLSDFIGHPEYTFRIKPRKEKRQIITNGVDVKFVDGDGIYPSSWQRIEIEVEV